MKVTPTLIRDGAPAAQRDVVDVVDAPSLETARPDHREPIVLKKQGGGSVSPSLGGKPASIAGDSELLVWLRALDAQADSAALTLAERARDATAALRPAASVTIAGLGLPAVSADASAIARAIKIVSTPSTLAPTPPAPAQIVRAAVPWTRSSSARQWVYGLGHLVMSAVAFNRLVVGAGSAWILLVAILFATAFLRIPWLHFTWTRLRRVAGPGRAIGAVSPGVATLRFFIPGYNLYWAFASHLTLCRAINEARANVGLPRQVNQDRAFIAVLVSMFPVIDLVLGMPLWFDHMLRCDRAIDEIEAATPASSTRALPAP